MTEKVVRWELEARGRVQRVGYRDHVQETADLLKVTGKVWNDKKDEQLVHIVAQGPESTLSEFVKAVTGRHGLIDASEVKKVGEKEADLRLTGFQQERGEPLDELAEATAQGARALNTLIGVGTETLSVAKETLSAVKEGNKTLGEKMDQGFQDLGSKMDQGFRDSIASSERLHKDFTVRFDRVDASYGMIGKTLTRMDKNLEKLTKAILALAQESHRAARAAPTKARTASRPKGRKHALR